MSSTLLFSERQSREKNFSSKNWEYYEFGGEQDRTADLGVMNPML